MGSGYELFRLFGIAVRLHPGFVLLLIILVIFSIAAGGEPAEVGLRLLAPAMLVLAVLAHEMGHALMARRVGLDVIDVVLTPLGGMARLGGLMEDSRKEAVVAAAGPGANLAVAALVVGPATALAPPEEITWGHLFLVGASSSILDSHPLTMALSFNLLLGTLNFVPAFPMDGGRILRALLSLRLGLLRGTRIAFRVGASFALALFVAPFAADMPSPAWWVLPLVGLYLLLGGGRERLVVEARERLGVQGRIFTASFGARTGGEERERAGGEPEGGVIDVSGRARVLDEEEDDDERSLPS